MKAKVITGVLAVLSAIFLASAGLVLAADLGRSAQSAAEEFEAQAIVYGAGRSAYAKFVSSDAVLVNGSLTNWVTALNTTVTLGVSGCVSVEYTGEATANGALPNSFQFRATLNGAPMNSPWVWFDASHSGIFDLASFSWWRCGVPAGTYSVAVQFKSGATGDVGYVRQRTLKVEY